LSAVAPTLVQSRPRPLPAEATRLLYERHSGRIFGYCLSLLGSREEAEDAVQTTFMNVQRGLDRGVVPQFELAWLFKIARNVCYNRTESSSRRRRVESGDDLDSLQEVLATPERNLGLSIGELTRALGGIPERQRRALLLREFQGMSYEEIAGELGVSVGAVETLLFRARRSLTDQLEQTGMPQRRSAVASVVALFRWFFDGGAVPLKLAAVTAALGTAATLAVAPALRSDPAGPVHVIPSVVAPAAQPKVSATVHVARTVEGGARARVSPTVQTTSSSKAATEETALSGTGSASTRPNGQPLQAEEVSSGTTPTKPPPSPPDTSTLPSVQDVTDVLPDQTPAISVPPIVLPQADLPVQLPELPKLP
jgi:RNA polymerase sigma-70 factor (ECF subfamily)